VALIAILSISLAIYALSGLKAPKPRKSRDKVSVYACGERVKVGKLKITVTLHEYLTYFVVLDSSALMVAFASLAADTVNPLIILTYLIIVLAASLILRGGD